MRVLDVYSGAGGAGMGYHLAGAEVVGWDLEPQRRYPFEFHQGDALEVLADVGYLRTYDLIHTSPPCKVFTPVRHVIKATSTKRHAVDLIAPTRVLLQASGVPYVIENVPEAPLIDPVLMCGSMFGLGVRRHRGFEIGNWPARPAQAPCRHDLQDASPVRYPTKRYHSGSPVITMSPVIGVYGRGQGLGPGEVDLWRKAMGIDWMVREELREAIPPAYTRRLAEQFLALERAA